MLGFHKELNHPDPLFAPHYLRLGTLLVCASPYSTDISSLILVRPCGVTRRTVRIPKMYRNRVEFWKIGNKWSFFLKHAPLFQHDFRTFIVIFYCDIPLRTLIFEVWIVCRNVTMSHIPAIGCYRKLQWFGLTRQLRTALSSARIWRTENLFSLIQMRKTRGVDRIEISHWIGNILARFSEEIHGWQDGYTEKVFLRKLWLFKLWFF